MRSRAWIGRPSVPVALRYALISGVMMIVLGFRLRGYARTHRGELPAEGLHQRV